jgi:methylmalonyl-CoA mutase
MSETKELSLLETFPPVSTEQWEEVIKKDLKGADYGKKLLWKTDDGITVKPYYRAEDLAGWGTALPTHPPEDGKNANDWAIREEIDEPDPGKANEMARQALEDGAEELCFVLDCGSQDLPGVRVRDSKTASVLFSRIPIETVAVHFRAGLRARGVYEALVEALGARARHLKGSLTFDPLGDLTLTGASAVGKVALFDLSAELLNKARKLTPSFKVLAVRAWQFHEAGGTTVQELGCALAQGIEYISEMTDRGISAEQAANALFFDFAVGSNYFFEIAKLRAARLLWAKAMKQFGVKDPKIVIHGRTSTWNTTLYDPYVNILRGATEAMSAAIGGCDSISVGAFDRCYKPANDFSRRLARNTQVVLKKEACLDRVADPAAGSYYIETLTHSLAQEAWKIMQRVEGCGGFLKCLEEGWIQQGVAKSRTAKDSAIAARRQNLLGTNQFPNTKERVLAQIERILAPAPVATGEAAIRVEPIRAYRGAEVFEALRLRMEKHAAGGKRTSRVLLLEIGDLKMRKARSAFCANFFACGGFDMVEASAVDVDSAVAEVAGADPDIVVLCSSDAEYVDIAGPLVRKLRDSGKPWPVIVAGYPKDMIEKLQQDGVADFVHIKSNAVEMLKKWQDKTGVRD